MTEPQARDWAADLALCERTVNEAVRIKTIFSEQALEGWPAAIREVLRLQDAIRKHRDQRGDDRCYLDDRELYSVLPEGYTPSPHDSAVTLEQCAKFIQCRQDPATEYVSPQREIERLQARVKELEEQVARPCPHELAKIYSQSAREDS